jgi:PAS domain S-box-containing protein
LTNIVERDLVTPSGRRLTLVNPAYMTRQVYELETKTNESCTHGHITSLKPLRPENAPDAWEAAALQAFEQGRTEVISRQSLHSEPHLRLMKPLITETSCLKCHAAQGYHVGDIRGGISVAVSMNHYVALAQARTWHIAGIHVGLWALGVLGIYLGGRQMRHRLDKQLQVEAKLRQSEGRLRAITDSAQDAILMMDPEGRVSYWNPAAVRILGYTSAEAFGQNLHELIAPDHFHAAHHAAYPGFRQTGQGAAIGKTLDLEARRKDGQKIFVQLSLSGVQMDDGWNAVGIIRDITERRRMEDKLRQLSLAVEQSPASIMITDPAGNIEYVNRKFTEVTGYTLAEVLGKNPRILKSGETGPVAYRELWQTITAGKEWHGEFHNKKKNGELYWEIASISPIRDLAGHITHFVAVKEDITARKLTEAERDRLIQELQSALANVKSLSGMLPICAGCKKIRDDKGYWNQVEGYIQKHSEATFSHGMCPDCMKKYYPGLELNCPDAPSNKAA